MYDQYPPAMIELIPAWGAPRPRLRPRSPPCADRSIVTILYIYIYYYYY